MKAEDFTLNNLYIKKAWNSLAKNIQNSTQRKKKSQDARKKQILIVDNEWNMLKLLYSLLSDKYNLVIKNSPIDALAWIEEGNSPSLVISEYRLPHLDKASFIQLLKYSGFYNSTPIIILSETKNLEQKVSLLPFKVNAILQKPFNPSSLLTVIKSLLNESELTIAS
ncbi:MAG: response regulator [Flavobacterium sp.]|nr:MAG: response regulator [Flavobacterium sp.]